jgi:hypothetical protein
MGEGSPILSSGSFSDLIKVGDTDRVFDFFTNIEPTTLIKIKVMLK